MTDDLKGTVERVIESYASSYESMSKLGDGSVRAGDVAYDLRQNIGKSIVHRLSALTHPQPWRPGREDVARVLILTMEEMPAEWLPRIEAATHVGTPPCKVAATCEACLWDDYLKHADAILALLPNDQH